MKPLSEADLQKGVLELAELTGWMVFHVSDSRREVIDRRSGVSRMVGDKLAKGWPDLVLVHPRRGVCFIRELKSDRGRLTPEQKQWIAALAAAGLDVGVWRPRDLERIKTALLTGHEPKEATSEERQAAA